MPMGMVGIRCQIWSWNVGGGGVRIFGTGVREKGGSDEPPEPPPGYGPVIIHTYDMCRTGKYFTLTFLKTVSLQCLIV